MLKEEQKTMGGISFIFLNICGEGYLLKKIPAWTWMFSICVGFVNLPLFSSKLNELP